VLWIPAYTESRSVIHGGMVVYIIILICGNFSLMLTVPWWQWPRLHLLRLIADTLLVMSLIDIALTWFLPTQIAGWAWTEALTAAVFRLETSLGLCFWYSAVYVRFGRFAHPAVFPWALGMLCMVATDSVLLWGTIQFEHGASDLLLGAGMPFWMVHQTMWSLGLYHVLSATPEWHVLPIAALPQQRSVRWLLPIRQGLTLALLTIVTSAAGSLRATLWLVAALVIREIVQMYEIGADRDTLGQVNQQLAQANGRFAVARQHAQQLNTELTAANQRLQQLSARQQELLAHRQLTAAEVAHDMGNALQDVKLALALIHTAAQRSTPPVLATIAGQLRSAELALASHESLLDALVAAAQLDAGALEVQLAPHDPGSLVERVRDQQQVRADDLGVQLLLQTPATLPAVLVDAPLLTRALLNIIGNALKYTAAARPDGSGQIVVTLRAEASTVTIAVTDNGPGIAPARLAELGQRFVRAVDGPGSPAGFGLGLAFARGVIEQHPQGAVRIESTLGAGTTVTITLAQHAP
jgi:signal transduction histidine kinase